MFLGKIPRKEKRRKIEEKVARATRRLHSAAKGKKRLEYAYGVKDTWLDTQRLLPKRSLRLEKSGRAKQLERRPWWWGRKEMEGFYEL